MRYFFAIIPPENILKSLYRLSFGIEGAKWQEMDKLHITLRFIEKLEPVGLKTLVQYAKNISFPQFSLKLMDLGHFPHKKQPTSLWAGVDSSTELLDLQKMLEFSVCRKLGLSADSRRFHPHLTLARLKGVQAEDLVAYYTQNLPLGLPPFKVEKFCLMHSQLNSSGSRYSLAEEFPLLWN